MPPRNGVATVAQSARVSERDGTTAQAVCRPSVCSCVCDVCLGGVSWIVVGEATVRMSSKCNRDMPRKHGRDVEYTRDSVECVMSSVCASAHVLRCAHSMLVWRALQGVPHGRTHLCARFQANRVRARTIATGTQVRILSNSQSLFVGRFRKNASYAPVRRQSARCEISV